MAKRGKSLQTTAFWEEFDCDKGAFYLSLETAHQSRKKEIYMIIICKVMYYASIQHRPWVPGPICKNAIFKSLTNAWCRIKARDIMDCVIVRDPKKREAPHPVR